MSVYFVKAQIGFDCVWACHVQADTPAAAITKAKAQQARDIETSKAHGLQSCDPTLCKWSARKSKVDSSNAF